MFITNKRAKLPSEIEVDGNLIKTVDNFKLLGVKQKNVQYKALVLLGYFCKNSILQNFYFTLL